MSAVITQRAGAPRDLYAVLGVSSSASPRQITSAYRRLVRTLHPDTRAGQLGSECDLAEVLAAYDTLRNPQRRAAYDAERTRPQPPPQPGRPAPVSVHITPAGPAPIPVHVTPVPRPSNRPIYAVPCEPVRRECETSEAMDLAAWIHRWLSVEVRWL
ncbi:J domain-containing protein [Streptomyces siderophoricus]|uniref:J domain-containing protein n=1 Tax=Streptomyces siderophoricus TaxID=2802281 RepID=UPI0027DE4140|nr:J domain-containing protein [Streptomyces sp. 9-7]